MTRYAFITFAQAYGQGTYNSCDYNCATGSTAQSSGGSTGQLANTGIAVLGIVTLACLIICIALIARIVRKRRQSQLAANNDVLAQHSVQQDKQADTGNEQA